jgi:hypothetical protein
MWKEMPVIPVNKVVDPKIIIGKNGGPSREGGEAQGVAEPSPPHTQKNSFLSAIKTLHMYVPKAYYVPTTPSAVVTPK